GVRAGKGALRRRAGGTLAPRALTATGPALGRRATKCSREGNRPRLAVRLRAAGAGRGGGDIRLARPARSRPGRALRIPADLLARLHPPPGPILPPRGAGCRDARRPGGLAAGSAGPGGGAGHRDPCVVVDGPPRVLCEVV